MKAYLYQKVTMSDGANLAVDVYLPDSPGPFPVILTRTPYHRKGMVSTGKTFTEKGYAYVTADTRGKFDSEGTFRPLIDEAQDGHDTISWIAEQKWCNGRIGMRGMSYLGIVQIPAASRGHEALKCIIPGVAPNSFFRDWIRYDGCFALANAVRWSLTHASCPTQPAIEHFDWDELYSKATLEEITDHCGIQSPALKEWVEHDTYDKYWQAIDQHLMYPKVTVPGLHIAGWFDHISRGQFDAYQGIAEHKVRPIPHAPVSACLSGRGGT